MTTIRNFTPADVPFGMSLKEQAGWNQLPDDWLRWLRMEPEGLFLAEYDGRPAGTAAAIVFDPVEGDARNGDEAAADRSPNKVAWIAMMLVEESLRGRGLGRALMEHAIAFATQRGAASIRLDATPLGRPLYEKLGFTPDFSLTRYGGKPQMPAGKSGATDRSSNIEVQACDVPAAAAFDRRVLRVDRSRMLQAFWEQQPGRGAWRHDFPGDEQLRRNALAGYYTIRPGSQAVQIGPCLADADADAGPTLIAEALQRLAGQATFIDVPDANAVARELAERAGLEARRPLLRMTRGPKVEEDANRIWASSGPEKG